MQGSFYHIRIVEHHAPAYVNEWKLCQKQNHFGKCCKSSASRFKPIQGQERSSYRYQGQANKVNEISQVQDEDKGPYIFSLSVQNDK